MKCLPVPYAWINQELVSCLLFQHAGLASSLVCCGDCGLYQGRGLLIDADVSSCVHAAKITHCGHVFCWSCMLHYLALVSHKAVHAHLRVCLVCAGGDVMIG